jgi:hypothetical protein
MFSRRLVLSVRDSVVHSLSQSDKKWRGDVSLD